MPQLDQDVCYHILDHVCARPDLVAFRLVSKEWEHIAARRLLRTCDVALRSADDVAAFHHFMFAYEAGPDGRPSCDLREGKQGKALSAERLGYEGEVERSQNSDASPRRFHLLTGHLSLALGAATVREGNALERIFAHATRLTSLAVDDFDATACALPGLVQRWAALPALTRLAVGYAPVGESHSRSHRDQGAEVGGWRSDALVREACFPAVKELFLHFGQRQSIPLGPWAAACPSMRRMHVCTVESAALGDVVREMQAGKPETPTISMEFRLVAPKSDSGFEERESRRVARLCVDTKDASEDEGEGEGEDTGVRASPIAASPCKMRAALRPVRRAGGE
ncbi:hypothetical protein C8Q76DRAFT_803112 [Earliella scabrosa]|nr:hypothetical protein C8Q76DRAFT_803112 [Earliella scabrosa]